ncbi:hypothetical protein DXG03_005710 [Asterophora parasitica]|uniref:Uncharacterized protein n=1 Tax=Asterophora parasitica TaxID=117018 RepID=A0A9P7G7L3_9AGAR|nr:hypothetical protein DXG03_005710 [Asterophora parasitica]
MDCLELNIHQRILSDIASNPGETKDDALLAQTLIAARVHTRAEDLTGGDEESSREEKSEKPRVFMAASRVHCNIAFGELIVNFPEENITETIDVLMPALLDVLNDIPFVDFDKCLSWQDWALPDQLVYSTVSALLRLSSSHTQYTEKAAFAICFFLSQIVEQIRNSSSLSVLTQLTPALHGLYRAISSTSFAWTIAQWEQLAMRLKELCSSDIIDRLNHLLIDILQKEDTDDNTMRFVQTFVSRYVTQGRPLSGYFIVCCVIETEWTVLAQALAPPQAATSGIVTEAAAANKAWLSLMRKAAVPTKIEGERIMGTLKNTVTYAMQCFTDLLVQIEEMETEPPIDTYAWETMSESLVSWIVPFDELQKSDISPQKLASICTVALQELDGKLFSLLLLLLSDESPISDNLVQEAALKATTVLVQRFDPLGTFQSARN